MTKSDRTCSLYLLIAAAIGCVHPSPISTTPDPVGLSRRDPTSMHAHQHDWPPMCNTGALQSPIALSSTQFTDTEVGSIETRFGDSEVALVDVGHTLQLRPVHTNDAVVYGGATYAFRQLHFHKASEHIVDGHQAPMEMHVVFVATNESATPGVLVLGFPIEVGDEHPALAPLWRHLEDREGYGEELTPAVAWERAMETRELDVDHLGHGETMIVASAPFQLASLVPSLADFFVYEGSLTTPDCGEGVTHAVASAPIFLSDPQIERFEGYYEGNNRDVQPLGPPALRRLRRATLRP